MLACPQQLMFFIQRLCHSFLVCWPPKQVCKLTGCLTLINVAWKSANWCIGRMKAAVEAVSGAGCVCVGVRMHHSQRVKFSVQICV